MNVPAIPGSYYEVIVRAAQDPSVDIDKLERLVKLQEAVEQRSAALDYNNALSAAQAEMSTISTDAANPQTRSRYATFAKLDGAIRPIYTKHGFGIQFNTKPSAVPDSVCVVGLMSHGSVTREFEDTMPISSKGIRGQEMMTATHAHVAGITYARRNLLTMMFNISTADDDGNTAAGRARGQPSAPPPPVEPHVDPLTGEASPHSIPFEPGDDERAKFLQWARVMNASVESAETEVAVDQWVEFNKEQMAQLKAGAPMIHSRLEASINKHRNHLKAGDSSNKAKPKDMKNGNADNA